MGDRTVGASERRVLLLGGTGFLGTHVRAELERDPRTVELTAVARSAGPVGPRSRWETLDLAAASAGQVEDLLGRARPDVVINVAGRTAGSDEQLQALNVTHVERLVAAMHRHTPAARLVHLGSAAEYGPTMEGRPTTETDEPRPVGAYGRTKLAGTRLVWGAGLLGMDTVVLRVFNPIGAGMDPRTLPGNAARQVAAAMAAGDAVIHLGPLGAHRDFVAAADVARATVAAAHRAEARGEVLNVGSGQARPARDLVRALADAAGFTGAVDEAEEGSARSGSVSWIEADLTRVRRALAWEPVTPFEDAVAALWAATGRPGAELPGGAGRPEPARTS